MGLTKIRLMQVWEPVTDERHIRRVGLQEYSTEVSNRNA
jgi:hypothetical protein